MQSKLSDDDQHNVMPLDQLLALSVSHLVEQGQLIINYHHNVADQPTTYEVRIHYIYTRCQLNNIF